jgi:hypothetical protein
MMAQARVQSTVGSAASAATHPSVPSLVHAPLAKLGPSLKGDTAASLAAGAPMHVAEATVPAASLLSLDATQPQSLSATQDTMAQSEPVPDFASAAARRRRIRRPWSVEETRYVGAT